MMRYAGAALVAFLGYLVLTAGSGNAPADVGLWAEAELLLGVIFALVVAVVWRSFFSKEGGLNMVNPIRWTLGAVYMAVPFFWEMAKANIDVAYRVITGKLNPAISKVETGYKTDLATTFLAHSITLTPGTLTLDLDDDNALYVHELSHTPGKPVVAPRLVSWVRRFAE